MASFMCSFLFPTTKALIVVRVFEFLNYHLLFPKKKVVHSYSFPFLFFFFNSLVRRTLRLLTQSYCYGRTTNTHTHMHIHTNKQTNKKVSLSRLVLQAEAMGNSRRPGAQRATENDIVLDLAIIVSGCRVAAVAAAQLSTIL